MKGWELCVAAHGTAGLLALGCAQGVDAEGTSFGMQPVSVTAMPGGDGSSSTGGGEGKESTDDGEGDVAASSDTGPANDTGPGSTSDAGGTDGSTGDPTGTTGDDGGTVAMCANDLTCATAMSIGGVAGDEGSPQLVVSGDTPTWLTFQVAENNAGVGGETLSFTVTLQSPAMADFDLYVTRGPEGGTSGCVGAQESSTNAGGSDTVQMSWGEGAFGNNADDDAWVAVEVRAKNGTCNPPAEWTLTVQGDT